MQKNDFERILLVSTKLTNSAKKRRIPRFLPISRKTVDIKDVDDNTRSSAYITLFAIEKWQLAFMIKLKRDSRRIISVWSEILMLQPLCFNTVVFYWQLSYCFCSETDYAESGYFVHSWVRVESGRNWLYVGCYWQTWLFVVFIFYFTFSSFYVVLCVRISL